MPGGAWHGPRCTCVRVCLLAAFTFHSNGKREIAEDLERGDTGMDVRVAARCPCGWKALLTTFTAVAAAALLWLAG